jgi:hypothetical protein
MALFLELKSMINVHLCDGFWVYYNAGMMVHVIRGISWMASISSRYEVAV